MIFPDYPEEVPVMELLSDLRSVVKDAALRVKIMVFYKALEGGGKLTVSETLWVRAEARRRRSKIAEVHASRDRIPVTNLRVKIGPEKLAQLQKLSARATTRRNTDRLAVAEAEVVAAQEAQEDLGI